MAQMKGGKEVLTLKKISKIKSNKLLYFHDNYAMNI